MASDLSVQTQSALQQASTALQASRYGDAALVLRRALDLSPGDAAVGKAIAQVAVAARGWLASGRADDALALLAPIAASEHAGGPLLMLYGHALMLRGRKVDAATAFRRWVRKEPDNREAVLRFAAVLADANQPADAETAVRGAMARHGESPEALFVLGRALLGQARFDAAEAAFRKVVDAQPAHEQAQANLMELVWMRSGSVAEASRAIDDALRAQPRLTGLRITKAGLLTSARMPREALAVVDEGLRLSPSDPALLKVAATVALDCDGDRAWDYALRLQQILPYDAATRVAVGNAALATDRAQFALESAEWLHRVNPLDGRALAMQADALRMLGDPRYRELLDYTHFVRGEYIDVPDGWADRATYLTELVDDLDRLHTLRAHPIGNSLRGGSQVLLDPPQSPYASIRAFPQAINGPVHRYMAALGHGPDPMRSRNTGRYRISGMWSVRLRANGFHVSHYHPEGWMSSACYLHLPPAVEGHRGEGWLQYGEPAFPTRPAMGAEFVLKPEPGLLALFPSYMWHGTIPFSGGEADTRMTIAFDMVPD